MHFNTIVLISIYFYVLVLNSDLHEILKSCTQTLYLTRDVMSELYCTSQLHCQKIHYVL